MSVSVFSGRATLKTVHKRETGREGEGKREERREKREERREKRDEREEEKENLWDLKCSFCDKTFGHMGALSQHEKWMHNNGESFKRVKKKFRRKSYSLSFKAAVLGSYDDMRALKCVACSAIVEPGISCGGI